MSDAPTTALLTPGELAAIEARHARAIELDTPAAVIASWSDVSTLLAYIRTLQAPPEPGQEPAWLMLERGARTREWFDRINQERERTVTERDAEWREREQRLLADVEARDADQVRVVAAEREAREKAAWERDQARAAVRALLLAALGRCFHGAAVEDAGERCPEPAVYGILTGYACVAHHRTDERLIAPATPAMLRMLGKAADDLPPETT